MKQFTFFALMISMTFIFGSCKDDDPEVEGDWLLPKNDIKDGGPGKDGIPSLVNPNFVPLGQIDYLDDSDLVLGFRVNDEIKAYPHNILDWHEIINDRVDGTMVAVTYCPLTGTGIGWNRVINGDETTFGVSGLLFNSNLIPYDRNTDSNWSQMRLECVNGPLSGMVTENYTLLETSWGTWKELYPNSLAVSEETGFSRNYESYPYGDYRTNNDNILFPVDNDDTRLPRKERVLGVIVDQEQKAYSTNLFDETVSIIEDQVSNQELIIVGNRTKNFIAVFHRMAEDGTLLEFTPVQDELPVILSDSEGNKWDIFGMATEGPRMGERLSQPTAMMSFWFAWGAFYPGSAIYE